MARRKALEVIEFFKAIYYKRIDKKRFGHRQMIRLLAFRQALEVIEFFNANYYKAINMKKVWAQII